jgi:predicted permease
MSSLVSDLRFALRWLRKSPGFTAVAVASLAVGIGFNTALFAVVDALLFRPLPVAAADRLVDVYTSAPSGVGRYGTSSYPDYEDLRSDNSVLEDLVGYSPMFGALNLGERSRLALGEIVTGNYFQALGVTAALGRTLLPEDAAPAAARVAMISFDYWTRALAGRPDAIGQTLRLRGDQYTIVGVAPRDFHGMTPALSPELWVTTAAAMDVEPIGMHDVVPSPTGTTRLDRRGERWLFLKGRLKPGVTVASAAANLDVVMAGLAATYPATNRDRRIALKPSAEVHFHPAADPVLVPIALGLMLVVGLVLVIACGNVASMLLARASARQKEIGIRLAIGASRARLVRQLVTESLALSAIGAVAGVVLAWTLLRLLQSISLPIPIPLAFDLRLDARAIVFTVAATGLAGLLAGLAPALRASRPDLAADLRGEAVVSQAAGRRWTLRDGLVTGQMAITALLLVVAALLTRSLVAAEQAKVGFNVERLALVSMDTAMLRYTPQRSRQFFDEALARVRRIPGVEAAALATRVPFSVNVNRWDIWVPGRHEVGRPGDTVEATTVSPDYFRTIGVPILEGRAFTDADTPDTPLVAIVNEVFARRYWPGESAIGKTFRTRGSDGPVFQIVGVSANHKVVSVGEPPTPFLHVARSQRPGSYACLIARTGGDAAALLRAMRRDLIQLEPNLVFVENQTMEGEVETTLFPVRAGAWMVSGVGLVAMLLAAVGLYGVVAYSVARRTREIGIRLALGARPASVVGLVLRQGLALVVVGLLVGGVVAAAATRSLAGALYGVGIGDPVAWGAAAAVVLVVSLLANLVPARRAARVDPSEALRTE